MTGLSDLRLIGHLWSCRCAPLQATIQEQVAWESSKHCHLFAARNSIWLLSPARGIVRETPVRLARPVRVRQVQMKIRWDVHPNHLAPVRQTLRAQKRKD